ncbi:alpha/beta-hydrolase [Panaeolus papilionaceus]|nr:alpha/beta-hydrolase [Panaeolus papilionaceus]
MLQSCRSLLLGLITIVFLNQNAYAAPTDVPSAASFYIPQIPYIHQDPNHPLTMFGGHLSADPSHSQSKTDVTPHLYFFMIKNRKVADRERVIFWFNVRSKTVSLGTSYPTYPPCSYGCSANFNMLQGGPGCSSFDGAMMEVGPWRWDGKSAHDFFVQPGGWEEYSTLVFVDQPAGTGFSYTATDKYVHTMDVAQKQFIEFLTNFYKVFPEYTNMDTYLAGESFAGQWIPYFADAILNSRLSVPLKGVAIGNGWMDSRSQYPAYIEYAVKTGLLEENSDPWKAAKKEVDSCNAELERLKDSNPMLIKSCQQVLRSIMSVRNKKVNGKDMCLNIYDIRLDDTAPACGMNWPPEMPAITNFLGKDDVVTALHANAHPGSWIECRPDVHRAFQEERLESAVSVLPRILEKIKVLIFAGDQDLICNYMGLENMIKNLNWAGQTGLGTVQTQSWNVNSMPAGTWVESRNLTYAKIFNASHMAPFDVPHVTHDMMLRFMDANFTALVDGSARIPSQLGTNVKPIFVEEHNQKPDEGPKKTPQQDKAMWEAYYNAGSAALVLLLVFVIIGTFVWCRIRRRRVQLPIGRGGGPGSDDAEESIPLRTNGELREVDREREVPLRIHDAPTSGKGKQRAGNGGTLQQQEAIFEVGDSEDEDDYARVSSRK